MSEVLNIGYESYVLVREIVSFLPYTGVKLRADIAQRKKANDGTVFDCSKGHTVKSVIVCKNNVYFLSGLLPDTLRKRAVAASE